MPDSIQIQTRPLSASELADLKRQAADAEGLEAAAQRRSWRPVRRNGAFVLLIYVALWVATWRLQLDVTKTLVSTVASLVVVSAASVLEVRSARSRLMRVRNTWAASIAGAESNPVWQIDIAPRRAWGDEQGWIFDLGDGRGFFAEWNIPYKEPRQRICWRLACGGFEWLDQSGERIRSEPLRLDWNRFPDDHALARTFGPAIFRLNDQDPAAALLAFGDGTFPLGSRE
jgi:hypothetical protein